MDGHRYGTHRTMTPAPDQLPFTPIQLAAGPSPNRFRVAHLALLGQGLFIGILGGFALAWSMANLHFGPEGMPVFGLAVTPLHGGLLMACGSLAVLSCLGRWTTLGFSLIAAAGWATLTVVCAVEAAHHTPGILGFDPRDTLLYGALAIYNLALIGWLAPTLRDRSVPL